MKINNIDVEVLVHACVKLKNSAVTYIDPFNIAHESHLEKADFVLITHAHYDHCSIKDIEAIIKPSTVIVTVADCQSKLSNMKVKEVKLVEPGTNLDLGDIKVTAVPAYNTNKQFHPKENQWVGFIVDIDGIKVYHAGDTDFISEMKNIDVDIALLPVSGTYVMTAKEAAAATKAFKRCKIAIPMHYGAIVGTASDAETFKELAECDVKILM